MTEEREQHLRRLLAVERRAIDELETENEDLRAEIAALQDELGECRANAHQPPHVSDE